MSKVSRTETLVTKCVLVFTFTTLFICSSLSADEVTRQPGENRHPKQPAGFLEWLFGPPVTQSNKIIDRVDTSTDAPLIFHQVTRTKPDSFQGGHHQSESQSGIVHDPLRRSEVHLYQFPTSTENTNSTNSILNSSNSNSFSPEGFENTTLTQIRRILLPKPRPRNVRSLIDQSEPRPIQPTIQTEINKEVIDGFDENLRDNNNNPAKPVKRTKRATTSKFRQLNIPYQHSSGGTSNNRPNTLSKRQLLISPAEQQMFAIRQQELAAASMLQQQSLLNPYGRYNNRYIDDYYDDDSSYEDSDEYYDHFNRNGLRPIYEAMRHGVRIPPIHHPYGIGRRSLPDQVPVDGKEAGGNAEAIHQNLQMTKQARTGVGKSRVRMAEDSFLGPISKGGRWGTIEDYDLSSDFNKLTQRKGTITGRDGVGGNGSNSLGQRRKELDEEEDEAQHPENANGEKDLNLLQSTDKGRSSLGWGLGKERQEEDVNITSVDPDTPEITSSTPVTISETSATEIPTSEEETTPEVSGEEEETTISIPSSVSPSTTPEEEVTSSTTTTTTSRPTSSKPRPTTVKPEPANLPPYHQTLNCRCGMQSVRGHDIGYDTVVRAMVNPWLVAIRAKGKHLCSGSIINNKYILTSKNCVHGVKGLVATAGLGSGIPKNFSVIRVNEHATRDLALLKIKPAITPNFAMRPICLPIKQKKDPEDEKSDSGTGILVTFKKSSQKGNSGLQLVQTEVPMLSSSKCGSPSPGGTGTAGSGSICPGPPGTMKCGGDPGGVLQVYHKGYSYEQIGVVSTTVGCRANKTPGVYTDIRKSVKWILYNTKDARYCRKPKVTQQDLMNTKKVVELDPDFQEEFDEDEDADWRSDEQHEEEESWARSHN